MALWQNLWVKMAHSVPPTGTTMEARCAKMAHQQGQTMSFSLWPVACKGIPVGRQVGTTCLGVFPCTLGCKTGHSYHVGTVRQPTDSADEASFFALTDATVWAPLCEELWFRALLYTSLRTRLGVAPSAVVTATLFASVHYPESLVTAAAFFFPAVLSSLWYERTRSLWPNVIAHSLMNTLTNIVLHAVR